MKNTSEKTFYVNGISKWIGTYLILASFVCLQSCGTSTEPSGTSGDGPPNIIVIISDDQGWGDAGFNGSTDIPTPHLDGLAAAGVVFSQGYVAHPYCSPSRAGLITGRHQQRFGHENNTPYTDPGPEDGLPLTEVMLSEVLKENGYRTCAIGKWHLGDHEKFWPVNRGFDDWYGFSGGGMSYWGNVSDKSPHRGVTRNGVRVPLEELSYLTDDFTREAVNYISDYTADEQPFFMYLAYNAPHGPIHATTEYLDMVQHIENGQRAAYSAMVTGMDQCIGQVVKKLKEKGVYNNTLIFFLSDNGGHSNGANSLPFRGNKGMLFEGGIRVPFLASWPGGLEGGKVYDKAISALDIFPTVLAAAGIDYSPDKALDGVNLLPYLRGVNTANPHTTLHWRVSDGEGFAVLHGNDKMIYSAFKQKFMLFNLADDPYEMNDLSGQEPEKLEQLKGLYRDWEEDMVQSLWSDPHIENVRKAEKARQGYIDRARAGEKK